MHKSLVSLSEFTVALISSIKYFCPNSLGMGGRSTSFPGSGKRVTEDPGNEVAGLALFKGKGN